MTDVQVKYWALEEDKRANRAKEEETHRANLASEGFKARETTVNEKKLESQLKTDKVNRGVSIANAVTGGIANVGKGFSYFVRGLTGLTGGAERAVITGFGGD